MRTGGSGPRSSVTRSSRAMLCNTDSGFLVVVMSRSHRVHLSSRLHGPFWTAKARQRARQYAAVVEFGVLGPLQVKASGCDVEIRGGLSRTLLAAMVLRARDTLAADTLIDVLWRDTPKESSQRPADPDLVSAQNALIGCVVGASADCHPAGRATHSETDPATIDAVQFERLVAEVNDTAWRESEAATAT